MRGGPEDRRDWPLWKVHLADELSAIFEEELVEDIEWALTHGFDQDAIRAAGREATRLYVRLRDVLERTTIYVEARDGPIDLA